MFTLLSAYEYEFRENRGSIHVILAITMPEDSSFAYLFPENNTHKWVVKAGSVDELKPVLTAISILEPPKSVVKRSNKFFKLLREWAAERKRM